MFAPLGNKDYSPFFGQIRAARPAVIYTSVAGNDTVRLFNQMAEFGLNCNVQVVDTSARRRRYLHQVLIKTRVTRHA